MLLILRGSLHSVHCLIKILHFIGHIFALNPGWSIGCKTIIIIRAFFNDPIRMLLLFCLCAFYFHVGLLLGIKTTQIPILIFVLKPSLDFGMMISLLWWVSTLSAIFRIHWNWSTLVCTFDILALKIIITRPSDSWITLTFWIPISAVFVRS